MHPLLIFGAGEWADLAHYYFQQKGKRDIAAFVVDAGHLDRETLHGLPVVAFQEVERVFPPAGHDMFIAVGSSDVNRVRARKYWEAKAKGYRFATFISPDSAVRTDAVGENCFIPDYNNIHPYVTIGNNVLFSNANHIGHHSMIEDHCFIASNVVVGGGARIGEGSFLGLNATVRDHVTVGKHAVIGAGALVMKDTPDECVLSVEGTRPRESVGSRIAKS